MNTELLAKLATRQAQEKRDRNQRAMNEKTLMEDKKKMRRTVGRWEYKVEEIGGNDNEDEESEGNGRAGEFWKGLMDSGETTEGDGDAEDDDEAFAKYTDDELVALKVMQDANLVKCKRQFTNR